MQNHRQLTKFALIALTLIFGSLSQALAAEDVQIISGGPATSKLLATKIEQLEKAAGAKIILKIAPAAVGLQALTKDLADGMTSGEIDDMMAAVEKAGVKLSKDELQSALVTQSYIKMGVHPDNPVKTLTKEQVTDILSGKLKSWEPITGQKTLIKVVIAKNYQTTVRQLSQFYIQKDSSAVATMVVDRDGLLRAIRQDAGAIGFFTDRETLPDFSPKYLDSHVMRKSFLYMKKSPRPAAQKVLDYIKANPFTET